MGNAFSWGDDMMPMVTKAGGATLGVVDTCKVPTPPLGTPTPTPFACAGQMPMAQLGSPKVLVQNMETVTVMSKIPLSSGNEAGVLGGVVSGVNVGEIGFPLGSSKVLAEGKAVIYVTAPAAHNGSNANQPAGLVVAPGQAMVLVSP